MRIRCELSIEPRPGLSLDPLALRLLDAIEIHGSLQGAARALGLSYRHLWGLLGRWERDLGGALVRLARGRGASLTPLGARVLATHRQVEQAVKPLLDQLALDMQRSLERAPAVHDAGVTLYASNDLALARLRDWVPTQGLVMDLRFLGSLDSLACLSAPECDAAGFHVAEPLDPAVRESLARLLRPRRDRLIEFAWREQGFLVPRGNPKAVTRLQDLTRPDVTLINRQRNSGTRLLLDSLLARAGIDGGSIDGYGEEEYTHLAVATSVAAGRADVGFGIRAAAEPFGLDFVPIARERYLLAHRARAMSRRGLAQFVALLRGGDARRLIGALPGYDASGCGAELEVSALLGRS
ncbi:MAG TPA: substrate-binding domain-containing protein [Pelomicrobium sp.]|nr:substrate-binding domain-containing protein [Pelomicrobium sp.]